MLHTVMVIASSWAWLIANFGSTDTDRIPGSVLVQTTIPMLTLKDPYPEQLLYDQRCVAVFPR